VQVLIIEGLHPFYDERVAELCDYKIYLDITPEVKLAWKIQRDMKERGHTLENIKASIESRKPDFDKYIDPQKAKADLVIQVLPLVTLLLSLNTSIVHMLLLRNRGRG
jgi:phosphoribulokinase